MTKETVRSGVSTSIERHQSEARHEFLPSLHLLRGLCAIAVMMYHYLAWVHDIVLSSMGTFGVYTFFVLSSLVLLHTHASEFSNRIDRSSLLRFYTLRIARIMPLLAAVALAGFFYACLGDDASISQVWKKTLLTATGLMALHMPGFLSSTSGAWSLGIEIAFYLVFLVLALLTSGVTTRKIAYLLVGLILAQQALLKSLPNSEDPTFWAFYTMPLTFSPFFAMGFLIHRFQRAPSIGYTILGTLCVSTMFGASSLFEIRVFEAGFGHLTLMALCGLAVYFAYSAKVPDWLVFASKFTGNISYSLYLTHWIAYEVAKQINLVWFFPGFAIPIAILFWRYLELPARSYLKSRFN